MFLFRIFILEGLFLVSIKLNKVSIGVGGIFLCLGLLKFVELGIFSLFIKFIISSFWLLDWKIYVFSVFSICKKDSEILKLNYRLVFVYLVVLKIGERVIFD